MAIITSLFVLCVFSLEATELIYHPDKGRQIMRKKGGLATEKQTHLQDLLSGKKYPAEICVICDFLRSSLNENNQFSKTLQAFWEKCPAFSR